MLEITKLSPLGLFNTLSSLNINTDDIKHKFMFAKEDKELLQDFKKEVIAILEPYYKLPLIEYYELCKNAHRNTSFHAERRGMQTVTEFSNMLIEDLTAIPEDRQQQYKDKFISLFLDFIAAKSRTASTMITGPANFNNRLNAKRIDSEMNKYSKLEDFRKSFIERLKKESQRAKTPDQLQSEEYSRICKEIDEVASICNDIDTGVSRFYNRALFVASLFDKIQRVAYKGNTMLIDNILQYLTESSERIKKPIFTNRHKVWKLTEVAEVNREKIADKQSTENKVIQFEGGTVTINYAEDRIQIQHELKPSEDIRTELKKNGFRWSPKSTSWQRQITPSGRLAAERVTKVKI